MFEIRCDKKGNWAEIADAVYVETAQREALSAELVFAGEAEIRRLNREFGITIIMVLHDINQSLYYSDEIVAMQDGRIRAQGLPQQIITPELVRSVYDVELEIREVDGKPFVIPV